MTEPKKPPPPRYHRNIIKKEYPEGYRALRMQLIRELQSHQCWADMLQISKSLSNVCFHAESMIVEQKLFEENTEDI